MPSKETAKFDPVTADYDKQLARGLALTGEGKEYYLRGRVAWLARQLRRRSFQVARALDFGCGTGSSCPVLLEELELDYAAGVDVSPRSIETARKQHQAQRVEFFHLEEFHPVGDFDLVYCNGVFHHVRPGERAQSVEAIRRSLRPGGILALWENNPWNPGTRLVMSRVPFDRDAILLWPAETRRLLRRGDFEILSTHFLFVFPTFLKVLRGLEPILSGLPLGGQYQVLARKPR